MPKGVGSFREIISGKINLDHEGGDVLTDWQWQNTASSINAAFPTFGNNVQAFTITSDNENSVYVAGRYTGDATFSPVSTPTAMGFHDIFVAKADSDGNWLWVETAGTTTVTGLDQVTRVIYDPVSDAVFLAGYFGSSSGTTMTFGSSGIMLTITGGSGTDVFVAKISKSGVWQWASGGGSSGSNDFIYDMEMDTTGNIFVCGSVQGSPAIFGSVSFSHTNSSNTSWAGKVDGSGNFVWVNNGDLSTANHEFNAITVDNLGNVYVSGSIVGNTTYAPLPEVINTTGGQNLVVGKLDESTGTWLNITEATSPGDVAAGLFGIRGAITVDQTQGNVYVGGEYDDTATFDALPPLISTGSNNIFVAKMSLDGDWIWAVQNTGPGSAICGKSMEFQDSGNVLLTGAYFNNPISLPSKTGTIDLPSPSVSNAGFITSFNADGEFQFAESLSPSGAGFIERVSVTSNIASEEYFMATYFDGSIKLGDLPTLTNTDPGSDTIVAKYINPLSTPLVTCITPTQDGICVTEDLILKGDLEINGTIRGITYYEAAVNATVNVVTTGKDFANFDNVVYDPYGLWDSANGYFIIPEPGVYFMSCTWRCFDSGAFFVFRYNGSNLRGMRSFIPTGGDPWQMTLTAYLDTGGVELGWYNDSTGVTSTSYGSGTIDIDFSIRRIG